MAGRKGRSGRKRLPDSVKKARGTRVRKSSRAAEPEPAVAFPVTPIDKITPPTWLDAEGLAEWHRVLPMLESAGVLSDADLVAVGHYCAAHSLAVFATKTYQAEGVMRPAKKGRVPRHHPMVKVAQDARAQVRQLARELGLTPSSRSAVKPFDPPVPRAQPAPTVSTTPAAAPPAPGSPAAPTPAASDAAAFLFAPLKLVPPT